MAEHSDLVNEIDILEKLSTQERLKIAKKRRMQQLKKWNQREKELNNSISYNNKLKQNDVDNEISNTYNKKKKKKIGNVHFVPSVILLDAAARNDIEEVRKLLVSGVEPDSTNEDGLTALHQCCIDNCEEMMKLLIDFGANINAKDSEQWTPLHAAATCGYLHLVKYLTEKNADLLAVNSDGNMPYDICDDDETLDYIEQQMASRGITQQQIDETKAKTEMDMLEFLKNKLEEGVDLNSIQFNCGASALHVAAANDYLTVVEFLLENNVSANICDDDQWQPIHAAACWGHKNVLELLVQFGADLNAKTKNGETSFDICEDIDLKKRIIQLKNEIESKQLKQQQLNLNSNSRLKRTYSQNTRSQSVRRTSIREKNQISRREAREEAKIRHHLDENHKSSTIKSSTQQTTDNSTFTDDKLQSELLLNTNQSQLLSKVVNDYPTNLNSQSEYFNKNNNVIELIDQNENNKNRFELPVLDLNKSKFSLNNDKDFKNNNKEHFLDEVDLSNNENLDQNKNNATDSSLKVEIPVAVNKPNSLNNLNMTNIYPNNSNINTLSDLKKLRSDLRHRNNFSADTNCNSNNLIHTINSINLNESIDKNYKESTLNNANLFKDYFSNRHNNEKKNHDRSSPNCLKKFKGNPSDMVDEIQKKKCCSIM